MPLRNAVSSYANRPRPSGARRCWLRSGRSTPPCRIGRAVGSRSSRLNWLESIKPVIEDEPEPAPRPYIRTQDDLPKPVEHPQPDPAHARGVVQLGDVKAQWGKIQKLARAHHPSLPALLEHARPRDIQGDVLILGVQNPIFKQKLEEDDKCDALSETLHEVIGVPLHVRVTVVALTGERDQAVDDRLAQDDVLAFGVNELGGEITDFEE
jgi:hypothetical protein